jgi:quercetin dioxygenase-like cupin family protein
MEQEKQQLADAIVKTSSPMRSALKARFRWRLKKSSHQLGGEVYKPDILNPGKLYRKPGYACECRNRRIMPLNPISRQTFKKTRKEKRNETRSHNDLSLSRFISVAPCGPGLAAENKKSQTNRAGSQPSFKGPAEYFTGNVRVDPLFPANDSAPFSGAYVTFEPGARSAWHIHPKGQHLLVTAGVGRTGEWGGTVEEIKAGDVIWCPPKVKHWHGASPTTAMTHIAITGTVNGKNVEWMEKVTNEQYNGK